MTEEFRRNTLTILGAMGYVAFLGTVAARVFGLSISWEMISLLLLTSSALLGVDFTLDFLPITLSRGGNHNSTKNTNDVEPEQTDKNR